MKVKKLGAILLAGTFMATPAIISMASDESLQLNSDPNSIDDLSGNLLIKGTVVRGVTKKGKTAKEITIPEGVTEIGNHAFEDCETLEKITIPDSVTKIGEYAFTDCLSLNDVTITENVTEIGEYAFYRCKGLTSIVIPGSVAVISGGAFDECESLADVTISEGVTEIGEYTFSNCKQLAEITIPESVVSVGTGAFTICEGLKTVNAPKGKITFESSVFHHCDSLESANLDGAIEIGNLIFEYCGNLESVSINNVTKIGKRAFSYCEKLKSIVIPEGVTELKEGAFEYCKSLESVDLPSTLEVVENSVFNNVPWYSKAYKEAKSDDSPYVIVDGIIFGVDSEKIKGDIYLPDEANGYFEGVLSYCEGVTSFNVSENNKNFVTVDGVLFNKDCSTIIAYPDGKSGTSYSIPDTVSIIADSAFYRSKLENIDIPDGVLEIKDDAFASTNIEILTIPDSTTDMAVGAVFGCNNLKTINLGANVMLSLGFSKTDEYAYFFNDNLESINVSENNKEYKSIDGVLFNKWGNLLRYPKKKAGTTYTIPKGTHFLNSMSFSDCELLTNINILSDVSSIGSYAFKNCTSLTSLVIPDSVSFVGCTFEGCTNLTSIVLPADYFGGGNFYRCKNLTDVYFKGTEEQWKALEENVGNATVHYNYKTPEYSDGTTGIKALADVIVLPENAAQLSVAAVEDKTADIVKTYDISFKKDGKDVQPSGFVTVKIPIPETFGDDEVFVYRAEDDGTYEKLDSRVEDGFAVFETDHFSEYVITTIGDYDGTIPDADPSDSDSDNSNSGDSEPGDSNSGDSEPGDSEPGDSEPGDSNSGDSNSGDSEPGDSNSGDSNSGDSEPDDSNLGDSDTSDSETSDTSDESTSSDVESSSNSSNSSSNNSGSDKNPETGFGGIAITLSVFALAGAAIVVTRKKTH